MSVRNKLIALLQSLPEDCSIQVLEEFYYYYTTTTKWVDLDLDELSDNMILHNNTLYLGGY